MRGDLSYEFARDTSFVKPMYREGKSAAEAAERIMAFPMSSGHGRPDSAPTNGRAWSASSAWRAQSATTARPGERAGEWPQGWPQQRGAVHSAEEEEEEEEEADDSAPNLAVGAWDAVGSEEEEKEEEEEEEGDVSELYHMWKGHARNVDALQARVNAAPASSHAQRVVTVRRTYRIVETPSHQP